MRHIQFIAPLFSLACQPVLGSVSLLFRNEGNWTSFASQPSALLFTDVVTLEDAVKICRAHNETLLSTSTFTSVRKQALEVTNRSQKFWLDPDDSTQAQDTKPPNRLPFLCTNSAPHTSKVDTDFTNSPKIFVKSQGTTFTGTRDHMVFRFMGIPYAKAPVGRRRFRYPEPFVGRTVDATKIRPACLQFGFFENNDLGLNPWGISEDCLFLNVFTSHLPAQTSSPLKPVMLWIHGGGNTGGTGMDATFDGGSLATRTDSVVVSINYRVNIFGFLALNDTDIKGNFALADKIASLQWVQDHIKAFGGDPKRVMIFGQSAGGWSVIDLVVSPKAAGLFSSAISLSGGSSSIQTIDEATSAANPIIQPLCNQTGSAKLDCLQSLPAETLLNLTRLGGSWQTVDDGVYRSKSSVERAAIGPEGVNRVPFMTGFMPDEGQSLLGETISPNDTDFSASLTKVFGASLAQRIVASGLWEISDTFTPYNATSNAFSGFLLTCHAEELIKAAAKSRAFPEMYVYNIKYAYALSYYNPYRLCTFPVGKPETPYYKCHSGELYEVFGTYYLFDQPVRTEEDILFTTLLQDIFGAFARTGNPNPSLEYLKAKEYWSTYNVLRNWKWPKYTQGNPAVASLRYTDLHVEGLPDEERCSVLLS